MPPINNPSIKIHNFKRRWSMRKNYVSAAHAASQCSDGRGLYHAAVAVAAIAHDRPQPLARPMQISSRAFWLYTHGEASLCMELGGTLFDLHLLLLPRHHLSVDHILHASLTAEQSRANSRGILTFWPSRRVSGTLNPKEHYHFLVQNCQKVSESQTHTFVSQN